MTNEKVMQTNPIFKPLSTEGTSAVSSVVIAEPGAGKFRNIIGCWSIGWSTIDEANRNIGWNLKEIGWLGFVEKHVKPAVDAGFTRLMLHNPGGTLDNEDMQPDQFIYAQKAHLDFITKDFVKAWRPITQQGIEVISYQGKLHEDPELLKLQRGALTKDNWLRRVEACYHHALDAGMSIAFDAIIAAGPDSAEFHFVQMLKALGVKIYIEPWPRKDFPNWFGENNITTSAFYPHVKDGWAATREQLTGEIIEMLSGCPVGETWENYRTWLPGWVKSVLADGRTPMVGMVDGLTLAELLR